MLVRIAGAAAVVAVVVGVASLARGRTEGGAAPSIASMSPVSGGPGTIVTLGGSGLERTIAVDFGGVSARFIQVTPTEVMAQVPPGGKSGHVGLTATSGSTKTDLEFTIAGPRVRATLPAGGGPIVTTMYPVSGLPGVLVQLRGTGLAAVSSATLGRVHAPLAHAGADDLRVMVPRGGATGQFVLHTRNGLMAETPVFEVAH